MLKAKSSVKRRNLKTQKREFSFSPSRRLIHGIVLVAVACYLLLRMNRGWIPHDDGTLAQTAERILFGELPHVDFDDPYTGGLSVLHAGAFQFLGTNLVTIRIVLFCFSLVFTSVVYLIASRFATAGVAGAIALTSVAWSVPNYFAGMPSWYNLFFAVFGTWGLMKYNETEKPSWLVFAGGMGGLSILMKVSGLFYVAAALLYLVYHEQNRLPTDQARGSLRIFSWFTTLSLIAFMGALGMLIRYRLLPMEVIHFFVPGIVLSSYLIFNEWRNGSSSGLLRFSRLLSILGCFGFGLCFPIVLFLIPYIMNSSLNAFFYGVLVLPQQRLQESSLDLPPLWTLVAATPFLLLLLLPYVLRKRFESRVVAVALGIALFLIFVFSGFSANCYRVVWLTTRPLVPISVIIGCFFLANRDDNVSDVKLKQSVFLLLTMSAMISLVQFPFAHGIYFCYAAPFVILATFALVMADSKSPKKIHGALLCFYLAFAVFWMNTSFVEGIGTGKLIFDDIEKTKIERLGSIRVDAFDKEMYEVLLSAIRENSKNGDYIFATADCPEIYFLSGRRNPTRTFFDFFDADYEGESGKRTQRILGMLRDRDVRVVVFSWRPHFSAQPSQELYDAVLAEYSVIKHFVMPTATGTPRPIFTVLLRN